jgi:hypothetical protein
LRLAYADPPYVGQAKKFYEKHPDYRGEVDQAALIQTLTKYDGWALSLHVNSIRELLPLCPASTRVAAWVKPFAFFKPGVAPKYAWEPVLFVSARTDRQLRKLGLPFVPDWHAANVYGTTLRERLISNLPGTKPASFCRWVFGLLGAHPDDELDDLFIGSGAVTNAWKAYRKGPQITGPLFAEATT